MGRSRDSSDIQRRTVSHSEKDPLRRFGHIRELPADWNLRMNHRNACFMEQKRTIGGPTNLPLLSTS